MRFIKKLFFVFFGFILLFGCSKNTDNNNQTTKINSNTDSIVTTDSNSKTNDNDVYYDIVFVDYDNKVLYQTRVKEGDTPTYSMSNPTRSNDSDYSYTFSGWSPSISSASSNMTYTATYTITALPYTISFNLDGGTSTDTIKTIKTDKLDKSLFSFNVKKSGYVFKGWSYNNQIIFDGKGNLVSTPIMNSNMTFKAVFEECVVLTINYSLYNPETNELIETYDTKQSVFGSISETKEYNYNTYVDLFANLNEGYTFIGWYSDGVVLSNETNYKYMMWEEDFTIEARIKYTLYDLYVFSNDSTLGQVMIREGNSQTYYNDQTMNEYYTKKITIAAYTKTDTRFLGWYDTNNELVSPNAIYTFNMANSDTTLEAKWNNFKITYSLDGGTNNSNNPTTYNVDMDNITLLNPTKSGYTFDGWYYNNELITKINTSNACNMNIVVRWKPLKYTVTLDNQLDGVEILGITSGEEYDCGCYITLTAANVPSGYPLKWIRSDGVEYDGDEYSFHVPSQSITIIVKMPYIKNGNKLYFGYYPQSLVDSNSEWDLKNYLDSNTITVPQTNALNGWNDYGYYFNGVVSSYMYYMDLDTNSDGRYDYRGVYFTKFRPLSITASSDITYQDDNGYSTNIVYWFKYEIIEWNILEVENGKKLLIANLILDSQEYYPTIETDSFSHNGEKGYANNYKLSNIRKWLNDNFYNIAFNELEKTIIQTTVVDNSASTTNSSSNGYACSNTNDKVFLLSYADRSNYYIENSDKQACGSDYAKVQGLSVDSEGYSRYWLRSPSSGGANIVFITEHSGANNAWEVKYNYIGVRPAIWIIL